MIIAIPTVDGHLNSHFGHSERFTFVQVNQDSKEIVSMTEQRAPEHQDGVLPNWLKQNNVDVVLAGNMGVKARQLLETLSISVISGAPEQDVKDLVKAYLAGSLVSINSPCACTCHH